MKNDWNPEDASGGTVLDNLTRDRLMELESAPRTPMRLFCDYLICFLPVLAGCLALAEYLWVPNLKGNRSTSTYAYFLAVLILASLAFFAAAFRSRRVFYRLRYKAPFYAFVFLLLAGYDILTLKRGTLMLPYFPWVDEILNAAWQDRAYLLNCTLNSLFLLFSGYFVGAGLGLVTGVACGYNRGVDYWVAPFMKLLGAIPSPTWIPVVMVVASSLFAGSVFIIALGVWYSLTIATMTGIRNIDRSFYEEAGYGGGEVHLLTTPDYDEMYKATLVVQEQLRQVGIDAKVDAYDFPTFMEKKKDFKNWDLFITSNAYQLTPQQLLVLNPEWAGANDPRLKEGVEKIRAAGNHDDAKKAWDELQGFLYDYLSSIALGQYKEIAAVSEKVEGFVFWQAPILWNTKVRK